MGNPFAGNNGLYWTKQLFKILKKNFANVYLHIIKPRENIANIVMNLVSNFRIIIVVDSDGSLSNAVDGVAKSGKDIIIGSFLGGTGGEATRYLGTQTLNALY
ncbi:MAG: diacylglycerol kinase family protein [Candidatus Njordarchaeia archaeon]